MSRAINFVQERQKKLTTQEVKDRQLFKIGAVIFGVVLVGYLVTFGGYLYLQWQMKSAQEQQLSLEKSILAQGETEKSTALLLEKISIMAELMGKRSDKQAAISFFSELFGPTVLIKDMSFNPDSGSLELNVESTSLFSLRGLFSTLDSDRVAQKYPQVTREELRRQSDAAYQLKLAIPLDKK